MNHFDAVDFSECHSEEVISFFWRSVYVTVVFKSWNIILESHYIHRTEMLSSVRRELCNMIGDRAASRPLYASHLLMLLLSL